MATPIQMPFRASQEIGLLAECGGPQIQERLDWLFRAIAQNDVVRVVTLMGLLAHDLNNMNMVLGVYSGQHTERT